MRRTPKNLSPQTASAESSQDDVSLSARVLRCAQELHHVARLAAIAAQGAEPEDGAQLLVAVVDDLRADLRTLRSAAKGFQAT